jgi:hypothetical protein
VTDEKIFGISRENQALRPFAKEHSLIKSETAMHTITAIKERAWLLALLKPKRA